MSTDVQPSTTSAIPTIKNSGTAVTVTVSSCTAQQTQINTLTSSSTSMSMNSSTTSMSSTYLSSKDFEHVSLTDSIVENIVDENDPQKFTQLSHPTIQQKKSFIQLGPAQPKFPTPHIVEKYYFEKKVVGGVTIEQKRSWLSYSKELDKIFCTTCLVFAKKDDSNVLRDGYNKWVNVSNRIKEHPMQKNHVAACETLLAVMCDKTIYSQISQQCAEQVQQFKREAEVLHEYLHRIIDCLRYMCSESIPHRGSDEKNFYSLADKNEAFQPGAGKFLNLMNLLGIYDKTVSTKLHQLREHYQHRPGEGPKGRGSKISLLSNNTQDKLVKTMGDMVKKEIVKCVNDAVFYSISADGTTDISLCEQMAITLRFVQGMEVKEHLIDLVQCEVTTGEAITEKMKCSLERNNVPLGRCVGSSFDGASNMRGKYKGVATRIQELAPMSINVYCGAHGSNLVMKACCHSSVPAVNIYGTDAKPGELQKLRSFLYGNARKRNQIFQENKKKCTNSTLHSLELAGTHTIRFLSLRDATDRVLKLYRVVLDTLQQIYANTDEFDAAVRSEAEGLLNKFDSFDTLATLLLFDDVFEILAPLNLSLQTRSIDLLVAISIVELQLLRNSAAQDIIAKAEKLARELKLSSTEFEVQRVRRKKRQTLDEGVDERSTSAKDNWKVEVFYTALDSAINVLQEKFQSQRSVLASMSLFQPQRFKKMVSTDKQLLKQNIEPLMKKYQMDSEIILKELLHFSSICLSYEADILDPKQASFINTYKFLKSKNLDSVFPELTTVYHILSTIPSSSSECERVFSKMKIIKSRLASRLTYENSNQRIQLATEYELMWKLNKEDVIKEYADSNEMKRLLFP